MRAVKMRRGEPRRRRRARRRLETDSEHGSVPALPPLNKTDEDYQSKTTSHIYEEVTDKPREEKRHGLSTPVPCKEKSKRSLRPDGLKKPTFHPPKIPQTGNKPEKKKRERAGGLLAGYLSPVLEGSASEAVGTLQTHEATRQLTPMRRRSSDEELPLNVPHVVTPKQEKPASRKLPPLFRQKKKQIPTSKEEVAENTSNPPRDYLTPTLLSSTSPVGKSKARAQSGDRNVGSGVPLPISTTSSRAPMETPVSQIQLAHSETKRQAELLNGKVWSQKKVPPLGRSCDQSVNSYMEIPADYLCLMEGLSGSPHTLFVSSDADELLEDSDGYLRTLPCSGTKPNTQLEDSDGRCSIPGWRTKPNIAQFSQLSPALMQEMTRSKFSKHKTKTKTPHRPSETLTSQDVCSAREMVRPDVFQRETDTKVPNKDLKKHNTPSDVGLHTEDEYVPMTSCQSGNSLNQQVVDLHPTKTRTEPLMSAVVKARTPAKTIGPHESHWH